MEKILVMNPGSTSTKIAVYQDEINYAHGWMIDARLFDKIDEGDWRKTTWIDPEDAGASNAFIIYFSSFFFRLYSFIASLI